MASFKVSGKIANNWFAEQLVQDLGALEMYCIGLAEHNDPHLEYAADAQEAVIDVLESNFSVEV